MGFSVGNQEIYIPTGYIQVYTNLFQFFFSITFIMPTNKLF